MLKQIPLQVGVMPAVVPPHPVHVNVLAIPDPCLSLAANASVFPVTSLQCRLG